MEYLFDKRGIIHSEIEGIMQTNSLYVIKDDQHIHYSRNYIKPSMI